MAVRISRLRAVDSDVISDPILALATTFGAERDVTCEAFGFLLLYT